MGSDEIPYVKPYQQKMKLLYFCIQMDQVGGVARIESDKINWLAAHGYDITVCDIEDWEMQPYYPLDARVRFMTAGIATTPGNPWVRLKGVVRAISRVRQIIREEQPDIIVNAHCPLVTWILPFVTPHTPIVAEMHQSRQGLEVFDRQFMGRIGRWLHRWSVRWIYSQYDQFVCLTNEDLQAWHLSNARAIPNFSSLGAEETKVRSHVDDGSRQIVVVARLAPQKRIDLMMQIWQRLKPDFPDWHVKVLGDGFEADRLRALCIEMGLESTFLMPGAVRDVRPELVASDLLCLTSEYEGFGIVLIEAMQLGIPIMAFEYVGVHDIIRDGYDGYVVPFGDIDAYVSRLRQLMTSATERARLATNAKQSVRKFDKEHVMQQWDTLFRTLRRDSCKLRHRER